MRNRKTIFIVFYRYVQRCKALHRRDNLVQTLINHHLGDSTVSVHCTLEHTYILDLKISCNLLDNTFPPDWSHFSKKNLPNKLKNFAGKAMNKFFLRPT